MRFTIIQDSVAILYSKGSFKQAPLFEREGHVYAKHGAGFIRLGRNGMTSIPTVRWESVELEEPQFDRMGRMLAEARHHPDISGATVVALHG